MFKKGEIIIYPNYGASQIENIYTESIGGKDIKYCELVFPENLRLSFPLQKAETIGVRYPVDKKYLIKALKEMKKNNNEYIDAEDLDLEELSELMDTGSVKDVIKLIMLFRKIIEGRKDIPKTLTSSEKDLYHRAQNFLRTEISVVLGENALKKHII